MVSTETTGDRVGVLDEITPDDRYFCTLRSPFGPGSILLRIGPLGMRLEGLSARQADRLRGRFGTFIADASDRAEIVVTLHAAGVDRFLREKCTGPGETYRLESRRTDRWLILWSYEFAGRLDLRTGQATLALVEEEGKLLERGLENFLRVLTAYYILERGGLLLHAAGVVRNGAAHLFFGPSGRGKTTVTHLSPDDLVLSDDLSLVVRKGDAFEAAGIPFGMPHHRTAASRESFPIASLNSLVQSPEVRREPLEGALAVAEVSASLPFVMQETRQASRGLEVVEQLLASVPAYRLWFRKDPTFWGAVEEGTR